MLVDVLIYSHSEKDLESGLNTGRSDMSIEY
jgi:hypothetical protein